jgi:cell division protease FtsH
MAKALVEWETLDSEQISAVMEGRELDANEPDDWTRPSRGPGASNDQSSQGKRPKPAAGPIQPVHGEL